MLNREKHEIILKQILKDIYKSSSLPGQLGFKGGTCLYIFYDLNRFSTDLDFNLMSEDFNPEDISQIVEKYLKIEDFSSKRNTWFWLGSYEKGLQKIKVEISKRDYPDKYANLDFLGITVPTLKQEYMFAHKLCAITDREKLQNRDLYDSWFMFEKKGWEPNEEIIRIRTGKSSKEYFKELVSFIKKNTKNRKILDGLGEVLDEKQKIWVKEHLVEELLFQLKVRSKQVILSKSLT